MKAKFTKDSWPKPRAVKLNKNIIVNLFFRFSLFLYKPKRKGDVNHKRNKIQDKPIKWTKDRK